MDRDLNAVLVPHPAGDAMSFNEPLLGGQEPAVVDLSNPHHYSISVPDITPSIRDPLDKPSVP